ncbi:hypothetical protein KVT40_002228 [Elsinoe batatas]|uniref:C3H1-type domain-containing protein n=1 Tax=Elsinoe batatas TaxID=2601811 RepID=A0A8K0L8S8_9PEZI|nr:hypothetical protein KVT40_002228 [Elsinoe batatas]
MYGRGGGRSNIPCKYYARGNCNKGDNCTFEHVGHQSNNRFSALSGQNNAGRGRQGDGKEGTQTFGVNKEAIVADLKNERPIWPFSAYAPGKDAPKQLLEGFPVEQSPEEMRVLYYLAQAAGNPQQAIQNEQELIQRVNQQIEKILSNPDEAIKYIISGGDEHPNRRDLTKQAGQADPLKASNPFSSGTTTSAFGKPSAFGAAAPSTTAFGQPSTFGKVASPFGGANQTSAFGQPSQPGGTSAFGQPSHVGTSSAFGQPSQMGSKSAFGQPSQMGGASGFGQPSTSAFGQPSQPGATSAFGQPSQPGATSAFGQPSQSGTTSAFGQPSQMGGTSTFGKPSQPGASAFGQPSQPGTSAFGQPSQSGASAFGQPFQPTTSAFGQPSPVGGGGAFGQPSGQGQTTSAFGQPSQPGNSFSNQQSSGAFGQPNQPNTSSPFAAGAQQASGTSPFAAAANRPSPFAQQQHASSGNATNPFSQPSQSTPSPFAQANTSAVKSPMAQPQAAPQAGGATDTATPPLNTYAQIQGNQLRSWYGKPVTYIDNQPYYSKTGNLRDDSSLERIWHPEGAPQPNPYTQDKEELYAKYGSTVEAQYKTCAEQGRFTAGIPLLAPKREWIRFDV